MKGNKLSKLLTGFVALIGLIGAVLFIRVVMAGDESIETDAAVQESVVNPIVTFSTILLYISVIVTVVMSLLGLFKNPAALKKTLIGLLVLAAVLAVSYFAASDAAVYDSQGVLLKDGEAGATSKWVGTGIIYSLILGAVAAMFFVFDLVKGLVK